jgi:uncharacterized coiled-coil DUF342 family protein
MKRLTNEQIRKRDELISRLKKAYNNLEAEVDAYNKEVSDLRAKVESEVELLNEIIVETNEWIAEVAEQLQEYYDTRSEKWQVSDVGTEYADWVESFDNEMDEVCVNFGEELESPWRDAVSFLEDLPEEP